MKRQKYNNGSLVLRKTFKNVGSIEGEFRGNQSYQSADITGSLNLPKGLRANASVFRDSEGAKNKGFSVEKQLKNNSSVTASSNKNKKSVTYRKGIFSLEASNTPKEEGKAIRATIQKTF